MLWFLAGDRRLSETALTSLQDEANTIYISAVTGWEIAIKSGAGRLSLPMSPELLFSSMFQNPRVRQLSLEMRHALYVLKLPPLHLDPMDRLLIAQSNIEGFPLVTGDRDIRQYAVETIW